MNWLKKFWNRLKAEVPILQPEPDFSKFTPRAQKVIELARQEAGRFNHNFVGTEHLLLGLVALGQGTAVKILTSFGINLETLRAEVEKQVGSGLAEIVKGNIPPTPRVRRVLALAESERKNLNHDQLSTGHILLGILMEQNGVAARILKNLHIRMTPAEVRSEVLKEISPELVIQDYSAFTKPTPNAPREPAPHGQFTPRAQQILALARKEADRLNHNFVGTEHLLLGLLALGQGVAINVLARFGINLETVRAEVVKQVGRGPDQKMIGNIPYTPRVKKVLALAAKEAKALNHTYVGTEHILLGLMREGDGVAARVLKNLGLEVEKTREEILRELTPVGGQPGVSPEQSEASARLAPLRGQLTPRAQRALAFAHEEAERFHHTYIGTEHVLLGMIMLGGGVAVNVLIKFGLDLATARVQVEKRVGTGSQETVHVKLEYTPGVKKAFAQAVKEAWTLNHTYVGTEHILLGILSEQEGIAAAIFRDLGIEMEKVRQEILKELSPPEPKPALARSGDVAISNFTPHSQQALAFARTEADRFHHNFVGTEHLFLGMLKLKDCTAVKVLRNRGVVLDTVRMEIEKQIGTAPDQKMIGNIPYTPRVKKVLALAAKEAIALNHTYVGTEHILLGLIREGDGVAARVLAALDIYLDQTRNEILKELDPNKQSPLDEAGKSQPSSSKSMSTPNLPQPIDTGVRYDVFCREQPDKPVVYRNVLFKSVRSFFPRPDAPTDWEYAELEEPDGQCVFVAKSTIVRFSPQGATFEAEDI